MSSSTRVSGVADYMVALQSNDTDRFRSAQTVFDVIVQALAQNPTRMWWWAKYYQIRCQIDAGFYDTAKTLYARLERETTGFGSEFGLADKFNQIKNDLEKRGLGPAKIVPPGEPPAKRPK